jgi:ribose 5-phosphate isomerase B
MYTGPLFITSDHAGYQLKRRIVRYIQNELARDIEDLGPHTHDPEDDFPDYIIPGAQKAIKTDGRIIVIGGSGNGEVIASNKVKGMRSALAHSVETAELARKHNDANGLALGARVLTDDHAMAIVKAWLTTDFVGGKYERRNKKIRDFENQ